MIASRPIQDTDNTSTQPSPTFSSNADSLRQALPDAPVATAPTSRGGGATAVAASTPAPDAATDAADTNDDQAEDAKAEDVAASPAPPAVVAPPSRHVVAGVQPPTAPPAVAAAVGKKGASSVEVPPAVSDVPVATAVATAAPAAAAVPVAHATSKSAPATVTHAQSKGIAAQERDGAQEPRRKSFFGGVASGIVAVGRFFESGFDKLNSATMTALKAADRATNAALRPFEGSQANHAEDGLTPEMVEAIAADNERRALAADPEAPPVLAGGKVESAPAQVITSVPVATPVPVAAPAPAPAPAPPQSVGSKMKAKMKDLARETRDMVVDAWEDMKRAPRYMLNMETQHGSAPTRANVAAQQGNRGAAGAAAAAAPVATPAVAAAASHEDPVATPVATAVNDNAGEEAAEDPLPDGWDWALDDSQRVYFINHAERRTTYTDPRISQS